MYHNVLHVFHDVLLCLTMFSASRNDRRLHGRIGDCVAADRLRDRDNGAGNGDNSVEISDSSTEIGDGAAGIVDISANVIPC